MGDQCLPAFAFKLFCVPEHAPPPPPFSFCLSQVYAGGGCSEPELSHQSKHKCMSCRPEATWFSLSLFLSRSALTSVFQCLVFLGPFVPNIPSCIENDLEQKWGMCRFQKPTVQCVFLRPSKCYIKADVKRDLKNKMKT